MDEWFIDEKYVLNFGGCTVVLHGICADGDTHMSVKCKGVHSYAAIDHGLALTEQLFVWRDGLKKMYERLEGACDFSIVDPGFGISIECQKLGQLNVTVDISANLVSESHTFKYEIDQSYLPPVIQTLLAFLEAPPKIGSANCGIYGDGPSLILP